MKEINNQDRVQELAGIHLGRKGGEGYSSTYNPDLLVAIPRTLNRESYGIEENNLPFVGFDAWNAYEVSAITKKGLPISGLLKIVCPADSLYHVESKSIKLYLNSLNMTPLGETSKECISLIESTVSRDLTLILGSTITCKLFTSEPREGYTFETFERIQDQINLDKIEFTSYKSDASQLEVDQEQRTVQTRIDFLRSNCRVTNQPDFGDIYIFMKGQQVPTLESLAKYVVSHREVSHFHEEIVEMTYTDLLKKFRPEELMVCALYSRRGGLDINPIRASKRSLIPSWISDERVMMKKTLKQ